ncbi:hypothetical protein ACKC9G_05755 [Pokkaliibacter sp. CJK22405]|uniref:hypothetical protein n=1 Tax=Pokkaliibacter sp. CJK22405 TaxID=3384615 RepID=UPI003984FE6D
MALGKGISLQSKTQQHIFGADLFPAALSQLQSVLIDHAFHYILTGLTDRVLSEKAGYSHRIAKRYGQILLLPENALAISSVQRLS